jgi:glutathione S-transferase
MNRTYVSAETAVNMPGIRIAFTQGVPGPWGEAVRAIYDFKKIDYTPVVQHGGGPNEALMAWTGQNSAPCVVINDERPRAHWSEMLVLAEQMAPEPSLIPANQRLRAAMFGICHELCGEGGFGWNARLVQFDILMKQEPQRSLDGMLRKFYSDISLEQARSRIGSIMHWLAAMLQEQNNRQSDYLVGDSLTAADIYWTTFSNMVAPLDKEVCPMPDWYRSMCEQGSAAICISVPPILIEHRERILHRHFTLPMWF